MKANVATAFIAAFLAASCGDIPVDQENKEQRLERLVGSVRTLDNQDLLSESELKDLALICSDLERKSALFSDYADTQKKLGYRASEKGCGPSQEAVEIGPFDLETRIDAGRFVYSGTGVQPPFQYVVTSSDGVMGQTCAYAKAGLLAFQEDGTLPRRFISTGGDPVWISAFGEGNPRCGEDFYRRCVYLETGVRTSENLAQYRIRDVKFFSVRSKSNDPYRGVVEERTQYSLCADEQEQAEFKSMVFLEVRD